MKIHELFEEDKKSQDFIVKVHGAEGPGSFERMIEKLIEYTSQGAGTEVKISKQGDDEEMFYFDGDGDVRLQIEKSEEEK